MSAAVTGAHAGRAADGREDVPVRPPFFWLRTPLGLKVFSL
ncbi:protein of unknown function [Kyrpidia spormannii]|uniref:Uncharacterized protein n=1 Tax=Kyrpidia spormannii TaxID=2055160 RepID=A0ACA8ZBM3_9BACL|nr:protein of unknown function [Kyrpidia spormannii]